MGLTDNPILSKLLWAFVVVMIISAMWLTGQVLHSINMANVITAYSLVGAVENPVEKTDPISEALEDLENFVNDSVNSITGGEDDLLNIFDPEEPNIVEVIELEPSTIELDFKETEPDEALVTYTGTSGTGTITATKIEVFNSEGEKIITANEKLELNNFQGKISITEDGVFIENKTINVNVNEGTFALDGEIEELILKGMGTIIFDQGSTIDLQDDEILIKNFKGTIEYDVEKQEVKLSGNIQGSVLGFK